VHLAELIGLSNRLLVLIDWMWDYFPYDSMIRLRIPQKSEQATVEHTGDWRYAAMDYCLEGETP